MTLIMRVTMTLAGILAIALPGIADKAVRPKEQTALFNGRDLAGLSTWLRDTKAEDPRRVFRVTDGMLHITGDGFGYVGTEKAYADYHLTVEFKWGTRTDGGKHVRNSGILLHATGADGNAGAWIASIECQLAQGCVGDLIVIRGKDAEGGTIPVRFASDVVLGPDKRPRWQKGGMKREFVKGQLWWTQHDPEFKELLDTRGKNDVESPLGEWTKVEVRAEGSTIDVLVNDKHVNHCYDAFPVSGRILLQSEGFELWVRKFEIRPNPK